MPASLSRGTENPSTCIAFPLPLPHSPLRGNCTQRKCFDIVRSPFISRSAWRLHLAPLSPPRLSRGSSFHEIVAVAKRRRRPANRAAAARWGGGGCRAGAGLGGGPARAGSPPRASPGFEITQTRPCANPPPPPANGGGGVSLFGVLFSIGCCPGGGALPRRGALLGRNRAHAEAPSALRPPTTAVHGHSSHPSSVCSRVSLRLYWRAGVGAGKTNCLGRRKSSPPPYTSVRNRAQRPFYSGFMTLARE